MRQAERRPRTDGLEDSLVFFRLGRVGNQQQDQIRLRDNLVHLAQRAVGVSETQRLCGRNRIRVRAQAHRHADARADQRVAQIARLRGSLRRPSDDADLLDPLERLRQQRKQMALAGNDIFLGAAELDFFFAEGLGAEIKAHSDSPSEGIETIGDYGQNRGSRPDARSTHVICALVDTVSTPPNLLRAGMPKHPAPCRYVRCTLVAGRCAIQLAPVNSTTCEYRGQRHTRHARNVLARICRRTSKDQRCAAD